MKAADEALCLERDQRLSPRWRTRPNPERRACQLARRRKIIKKTKREPRATDPPLALAQPNGAACSTQTRAGVEGVGSVATPDLPASGLPASRLPASDPPASKSPAS